ncbi:MAG TPA: hypothetical protein VEJ87_02275 [Acidimicrobiales bacterium]|nr:hypothetical protein [Acidimicrobiales bacterium]
MSRFLRRGTIVLAAIFVLAGSATTALGTATTATADSQTTFQHYLCYNAVAPRGFSIPAGVELINSFSPDGFVPTFGVAWYQCNPAAKTVPGASFPITNPRWHYLCFGITADQPSNLVTVTNQFGSAELTTTSPNDFCAPSWTGLFKTPDNKQNEPADADHYTCYPVTYSGSGTYSPPSPVQVADKFTPPNTSTTVTVGDPEELCIPTEKILPTGGSYPINNPNLNYLCFGVSQTPIKNRVFDQNQFGRGAVAIRPTQWLCLPSTVSPAGGG